jgi:hypothetical protein
VVELVGLDGVKCDDPALGYWTPPAGCDPGPTDGTTGLVPDTGVR